MDFEKRAYYTPKEVAEIARVDVETVLRRVRAGELQAAHLSARTIRIPLGALMQWLEPSTPLPIRRRDGGYEQRPGRVSARGAAVVARGRMAAAPR
jgi:excisionase family DNA binding protein